MTRESGPRLLHTITRACAIAGQSGRAAAAAALAGLAMLVAAGQALAVPEAYTLASGSVTSANGFVECIDYGSFDTTGSSNSSCTRNFELTGSGGYQSSAAYGVLKASAFASAGTAYAPNNGGHVGNTAEFRDAFTAVEGSCTTCIFSGTISVTATLSGGAGALNPGDTAQGQLTLSLINASNPSLLYDQEGAAISATNPATSSSGPCGSVGSGVCTITAVVPYTVGDKVYLTGILQTQAWAYLHQDPVTGNLSPGLAHADFMDTAMINSIGFYDGDGNLVPDAVFTWTSGATYAVVPAPAAGWLLGSGIVALSRRVRRRPAGRSLENPGLR